MTYADQGQALGAAADDDIAALSTALSKAQSDLAASQAKNTAYATQVAALEAQVATLTQESREQKLALKWLKGAGGVVLAILGYVVTFLKQ